MILTFECTIALQSKCGRAEKARSEVTELRNTYQSKMYHEFSSSIRISIPLNFAQNSREITLIRTIEQALRALEKYEGIRRQKNKLHIWKKKKGEENAPSYRE